MAQAVHHFCVFETVAGFCGLAWNDMGIARFQLPTRSAAATERALLRRLPDAVEATPTADVAKVVAAAKRYFAGEPIDFSDVAVDLSDQDDFLRQVYTSVRQIGWGRTTTYGTVAKTLGRGPETARDVGQAMAHNPVPLISPCHRVLAAGCKVGGFSAPGGAVAKQRMLELEGVQIASVQSQQSFRF
ncbi:MAG: methylated-DNA--[protein]-cysteine S-methyltransferase [Rhodopila sp.]